ncbi:type II toxin-antitoxin system HicA family toxin [Accumulibacter sp.]|uniref:type II toxin-antitoxin system HicA family toxin n=2 Tax=Accumulibacter sp. TaxID=2053492 RepID=UPI00338F1CAC
MMRCSSPGLRSRLVRLRVFSGSDLCRLLGDHGFEVVRQRGSHAVMQKRTAGTTVTVPSRCTTKSASGRFNPSSASQACPSLCSSKVEHSGLRRKRLVFVSPAPKGHGASHRTVTRVAAGTVDRSRKRGLTPISPHPGLTFTLCPLFECYLFSSKGSGPFVHSPLFLLSFPRRLHYERQRRQSGS